MELRKTFRFEASHILPKHPGKCSRLHGHSWVLHVSVNGTVNPETGFVQDFADISKVVQPIVEALDHRHLGTWNIPWTGLDLSPNTILDYWTQWAVGSLPVSFYPSSENLLWWIAGQLGPLDVYTPLGKFLHSFWSKVAIEETCTSYAELSRKEYNSAYPSGIRSINF